jgi:hypothetical protein
MAGFVDLDVSAMSDPVNEAHNFAVGDFYVPVEIIEFDETWRRSNPTNKALSLFD